MRLNERVSGACFRSGCRCFFSGLFLGDRLSRGPFLLLGSGSHESDGNMAGPAENRAGGTLGTRLEAAHRGSASDDGFLDHQSVGVQRKVVFGIGDGGLESLPDKLCGLLRSKGEDIQGARYRQTLNFTGDVTCLFRRETYEFSGAFDFHGGVGRKWLLRWGLFFEDG